MNFRVFVTAFQVILIKSNLSTPFRTSSAFSDQKNSNARDSINRLIEYIIEVTPHHDICQLKTSLLSHYRSRDLQPTSVTIIRKSTLYLL